MTLSKSFYAISVAALLSISGCALSHKRSTYPDPDRLVSVVRASPSGERPISKQDLIALRSESKTLEPVAGYMLRNGVLRGEAEPERIQIAMVSAGFFPALGVLPDLGRALHSEDNQPGKNSIAVISHRLWQRRYGADPNLIGRAITLDQEWYTVVGVMPSDFQFPKECDAWTPLAFDDERVKPESNSVEMGGIARLKPGATLDQAQAEVGVIARKLEGDHPEDKAGRDIKLTALHEIRSQELKTLRIKIDRPANPPVETGKGK